MLGMSELTLRDPDLAFSALVKLWEARRSRLGLGVSSATEPEKISRVRHFTFSDSIAIYTDYDSEADLRAIIVLCTELSGRPYIVQYRCAGQSPTALS